MKRLVTLVVGLIALVALTACVPLPSLTNGGFTKARTPNRSSITVANPGSAVQGGDMINALHEFNAIAGWRLLAAYPVNDLYGALNADIRFGVQSPIYPHNNPANGRVAAWVQPILRGDGSLAYCNIFYDPHYSGPLHPDLFSHEIVHCLGFIYNGSGTDQCGNGYAGVGSYCNFWPGMNAWWQQHDGPWWDGNDQQMLANAGYR